MSDNYKSLPFIVGVSLLFIVPIGVGGFAYSSLGDNGEESETTNQKNQDPLEGFPSEQNIEPRPVPPTETGGAGTLDNSSQGIPTGKYSNPPTQIETFGSDAPSPSRPLDDSGSVELNRLRQNRDRQTPDYSMPAASNDFKDTEDNSLVDPLSDDSFLQVPESEDSEPLSPVTEPLFGQPTTPFAN